MGPTERLPRHRTAKTVIAVILLAGLAAGLNSGLQACASSRDQETARPLNAAELARLAGMRQRNFGDGRVAVRGTVGKPGAQASVNGWVDWKRSLIYLSVSNAALGSVALIQARPGVMAIRPEKTVKTAGPSPKPPGPPPATPPADGWRVRPIELSEKEKYPLDSLVAFLLLLGRDQPDRQDLLGKISTQWVRKDKVDGADVDVLLGPAVLPESVAPPPSSTPRPNPSSLDTYGGAVGYWLDANGRLRKVETMLGTALTAAIEFRRDQRTEVLAIASLGGRDIDPREVSDAEAEMLSLLRQRNFHSHYAELALTLPAMPGTLRTAKGWVDWQRNLSYLSIVDADDAGNDSLVHANKTHVSKKKPDGRAPDRPPVPAPKGGWERVSWGQLSNDPQASDIDVLLHEVMSMASQQRDDTARMRSHARRLRVDMLNGAAMGVFELPNVFEQHWAPGAARVRYWIDNTGVLRRLEIRTGTGGFAQLDLTPATSVPSLPASIQ